MESRNHLHWMIEISVKTAENLVVNLKLRRTQCCHHLEKAFLWLRILVYIDEVPKCATFATRGGWIAPANWAIYMKWTGYLSRPFVQNSRAPFRSSFRGSKAKPEHPIFAIPRRMNSAREVSICMKWAGSLLRPYVRNSRAPFQDSFRGSTANPKRTIFACL